MKVLAIGDLHLDLAPRGGVDRWSDLREQLARIEAAIGEHQPDVVVQLGDVTDPGSGPRTVRAIDELTRFWSAVPAPHRFQLAGNHDVIDHAGFSSTVASLRHVGVTVFEAPTRVQMGAKGPDFLMLPYLSGAHAPDDGGEKRTAQAWLDRDAATLLWDSEHLRRDVIVFAHLDINGAIVGSEDRMLRGGKLQLPAWIEGQDGVRLIVCGHIHRPQRVRAKIVIVGAIERLDFGEAGDARGYLLFEV